MSYWSDRQKELYSALEKDENELKQRLASVYQDEYNKLDREIAAYYQKYGENNVIKYRKLMQTLPEEDARMLIEQMDDFVAKYPQYAHLVPVRTSIYKLDRLEGLQYSVRIHQLNIGAVNQQAIAEHLNKQALRGANAAMETMGFGKNFYTVNSDIVKKFVDVPWCNGLSFSQRIWQDGDKLANYITTDIAQGFARGTSYEKLTKQLRTRFEGVSKKDAYRLIYTEGTYVMAESTIQPFTEDFDEYRVSTAADGKVCDICASMAKGTFKIKDRKPGINFPPFHPWCRCTFEIVEPPDWDKWMDDYVKRHKSSGEKVLNNLSDNGIIKHTKGKEGQDVHYIGKINKDIYKCVTKDIITDDVIITDERINHIKERHPNDFEKYCRYMEEIVAHPEYIIEANKNKSNTALILKSFSEGDEQFKTILRLITSSDNKEFKNSIITFMRINEREWERLIRNKKILYKSE